jgi:hypothetical protein
MRYFAILLLMVVTGFSADYREATTAIIFPEKCDAWARTRVNEDPRKEIGTSVAYSIRNGSAITCRVLDGQFGPPKDDDGLIKKEMEEISAGIFAVWQQQGAKVELALPIGPIPSDKRQFAMLHRIDHPRQSSTSITLFRYYKGRYLSFRFTTPEQDSTAAFNEMGRFLAALRASQKKEEPNQAAQTTPGLRPSVSDL